VTGRDLQFDRLSATRDRIYAWTPDYRMGHGAEQLVCRRHTDAAESPVHRHAAQRTMVGGQMVDKRTDSMSTEAPNGVARVRPNRHIVGTISQHACWAANRLAI